MNIVAAMAEPALFGPSFQPPETWAAWGAFLRAAFGLTMSPEELALFRRHHRALGGPESTVSRGVDHLRPAGG